MPVLLDGTRTLSLHSDCVAFDMRPKANASQVRSGKHTASMICSALEGDLTA